MLKKYISLNECIFLLKTLRYNCTMNTCVYFFKMEPSTMYFFNTAFVACNAVW